MQNNNQHINTIPTDRPSTNFMLKKSLLATAEKSKKLITVFYFKKYFEWGLPTRNFVQVNIETNNVCTRKCAFCLYGIKDKVPPIRMTASLFFKIIDDLVRINFKGRLSLFNINEPLTDKRIYGFVRYASLMLPGAVHVLVTNGDILDREKIDTLFANGLDLLFINSYDKEAIEHNLSLYHEAHPIYPTKIIHNDRTNPIDWAVSRAGHIKKYLQEPAKGFCDWPNQALYVKPDGEVLACCHDFDRQNKVGDLNQQSVNEVWYGDAFSKIRWHLNHGDRGISPLCLNCDHKPDITYFSYNYMLAYRLGKTGWLMTPKPSKNNVRNAQAIKLEYLEREHRSKICDC